MPTPSLTLPPSTAPLRTERNSIKIYHKLAECNNLEKEVRKAPNDNEIPQKVISFSLFFFTVFFLMEQFLE